MRSANPFLDPAASAQLYGSTTRLQTRSHALKTAKIAGASPWTMICDLAARYAPHHPRLLEVGCGTGGLTARLIKELAPRRTVVLDRSAAMLAATARRAGPSIDPVHGDFRALPFENASFDLLCAAFCLYHSPTPSQACAEIARCAHKQGLIVLATKAAESYRELDDVVARSGLDRDALNRASLYHSFHSHNMAQVASNAVHILEEIHDQNTFSFTLHTAARYVATSPKYTCYDVASIADIEHELRRVWPTQELITHSTVSYVAGRRR